MFSDGVGTMSWDVAKICWSYLPMYKATPTCFQIRMGGAKGMLAVDGRLTGRRIQVRPSMIKFATADMQDLEICETGSRPVPLYLNRQMIKILEDLGIPDEWFFKVQRAGIERIRSVTAKPSNTAKFLRGVNVCESIALHRLIRYCGRMGIDYRADRFLCSIVEAVVLRELRLLKHKARIPIDKGITLYGVMDETGYLAPNEVFITFDLEKGRDPLPAERIPILVTRSPALYDGDVQQVYSAIPPEGHPLTHLRNCIVFSRRGQRDLPGQLSGGDLDGDIYNIIWDEEAVPKATYPPADYPRVEPIKLDRPVEKEDIADFFIDFMRTDHLGIIANRHLILADQMEEGTHHPDCKKLAELHSTAVDFSKTGIPVKMEELPRANTFRPDLWVPSYSDVLFFFFFFVLTACSMAPGPVAHVFDKSVIELDEYIVRQPYDEDEDLRPPSKYYKSDKILGRLYRAVDEREVWHENVRARPLVNGPSFWDGFIRSCVIRCREMGVPVRWTHRTDEARRIRTA